MRACLAVLPGVERRVLLLRADGRSRAWVARHTHASLRRVIRVERAGVAHLRAVARRGACGLAAGALTAPTASGPPSAISGPQPAVSALAAATGARAADDGSRRLAGLHLRSGRRQADETASAAGSSPRSLFGPPAHGGAAGIGLATALVALALVVSATGFGRELLLTLRARSRRGRPR